MRKYHFPSILFLLIALFVTLAAPACGAVVGDDNFSVNAASAILVDNDFNEVLYEFNADERRFPASITKVMTGLLTVEAVDRGELSMGASVTLDDSLYTGIGADGSTQGLVAGEVLTVKDLLCCALIPSANEACNALAVAVAGDIPTFVERMNTRAQELGMDNTHFVNTHGYHDENHYTTARDIVKMCQEAMKHPDFREVVSSKTYSIPATNLHAARDLFDTNALLSAYRSGRNDLLYSYAIGIKTGSTPEAGYCLASAAEKEDRTMIAVILGGQNIPASPDQNYFAESKRLLEHGFNDFSRQQILDATEPVGTIPVTLCAEQDYVTVQPAESLEATLANGVDAASFTRETDLPETLEAPIVKGQKLGTLHIKFGDQEFGTVDLVATSALERSQMLYVQQQVMEFLDQIWVKAALVGIGLLTAGLILRLTLFSGGRRSKSGGGRGYRGRRR